MNEPIRKCAECGLTIPLDKQVDLAEFRHLCYACYSKQPKHVCVDFDGVLAKYTGWMGPEHLGEPLEGARDFLVFLARMNLKVVILTTRNTSKVWDWLHHHAMNRLVHSVTNQKLPALAYIDDRGLCFRGNFQETIKQLAQFKPYWKV